MSGDARGAIGPLRDAVRLAPRFTEAKTELAEALAASGDLHSAVSVLESAVRMDPERHPGAWNDLGLFRLQLGQAEPARAALRRGLLRLPGRAGGDAAGVQEAFRPVLPARGRLGR